MGERAGNRHLLDSTDTFPEVDMELYAMLSLFNIYDSMNIPSVTSANEHNACWSKHREVTSS